MLGFDRAPLLLLKSPPGPALAIPIRSESVSA
jgi:hypothetical protein